MNQEKVLTNQEIRGAIKAPVPEKLWTPNFFILWQGQFISLLGDVVYSIALGFWVLAATGSTALMGTLMAASTLPKVLISPFAGVIVDRTDRKKLMVVMDSVRGVTILLLAAAAHKHVIGIWMAFAAGIILGTCGVFFSPAVSSLIPDVVPPSRLMGANSMMGIVRTGSSILGNSAGGFLFQLLGAPFLFLFNGLSFLASGILTMLIKIPKVEKTSGQRFYADMGAGYKFIWNFRGVRYMLILTSALNFLFVIAQILLLPFFHRTESLGAARYGVATAFLAAGMMLAMSITSIIKVPPYRRLTIFMFSAILLSICFPAAILAGPFPLTCALMLISGTSIATLNIFIDSTIQLTVPQDMRGKVFALVGMVASSLTPFGMALGGILGEYLPLRMIIFTCCMLMLLFFLPFSVLKSFKRFINFDPEKQTLQDIL